MGRIGNSLDNREVEYFFSNLKSECWFCPKQQNNKKTKNNIKKFIIKKYKTF